MSKKNFYEFVARQDSRLRILPGRVVGSWMQCVQHQIHQQLLSLPRTIPNAFIQARYAPWRTAARCMQSPNLVSDTIGQILGLQNWTEIPDVLRQMHRLGVPCLFRLDYDPDMEEPSRQIIYLHIDEDSIDVQLTSHKRYLAALFESFGLRAPQFSLTRFENGILKERPTKHMLQNAAATFNPIDKDRLSKRLAWLTFYFGDRCPARFSVDSVAYFEHLGFALECMPLSHWQDYLLFHLLRHIAPWFQETHNALILAEYEASFDNQHQEEYVAQMTDYRRVHLALESWPMDCGAVLINENQKEMLPARAAVTELVEKMRQELGVMIEESRWQPLSKHGAKEKLQAMQILIGWPDDWERTLRAALPADCQFLDEWLAAGHDQQFREKLDAVTRPTRRGAWRFISPAVTNACYSRELNTVYLPMSLFVPPFYHATDAVDAHRFAADNMGGIGAILAHELYHAFDWDSHQVSADGRLLDWWDPLDLAQFQKEARKTVQLYSAKRAISGNHKLDGRLTLSENIADLAALDIAWRTFVRAYRESFAVETPDEAAADRFFRAFALTQVQLYTPQALRYAMRHDLHALAMARVNLPLACFAPFLHRYQITAKNPMFISPELRPNFLEKRSENPAPMVGK